MAKEQIVQNNNNNGIGFFGLLTIVFVIAKLTGHITWSWFWVFSPLLIGTAFVLVLLAIALFCMFMAAK